MSGGHTPGPLHVQQDSEWPYVIRICDGTGETVSSEQMICSSSSWRGLDDARALVGIHGNQRDEWKRLMDRQMADMLLRAAAPEILTVLLEARDIINATVAGNGWRGTRSRIDAAIAKAIGK